MKIIEWPQFLEGSFHQNFKNEGKSSAISVGVFDGVHRGHRALIERIVAHNTGSIPVVVTFRQSNYKNSEKQRHHGDITSFRQKIAIFEDLGVSVTIVVDFSESFRRLPGIDFFRLLLEHGKMSFLAVGSNFRCGYQQDTDVSAIQKFASQHNVLVDAVQPLTDGERLINSSQIRSFITQGMLKDAAAMLGHPFAVDLVGASINPSANPTRNPDSIAYDISKLGRILPSAGNYNVLLLRDEGDKITKRPAEVIITEDAVITGKDASDTRWEYAEFV